MSKQKCLMLGTGTSPLKRRLAAPDSVPEEQTEWVSLDLWVPADIKMNLADLEVGADIPGGPYGEIHAYEVLEHFGSQGNFKGFFNTFNALWRALVPGGYLIATCPSWDSFWAWQDPGHTRVIGPGNISFLIRAHYDQLGKTSSTDYRSYIDPHWWEIVHSETVDGNFSFGLKKV